MSRTVQTRRHGSGTTTDTRADSPGDNEHRGNGAPDGPDLRRKMLPDGCAHRPIRGPGLDPLRHARDGRACRAPPERSRHVIVNPNIPRAKSVKVFWWAVRLTDQLLRYPRPQ